MAFDQPPAIVAPRSAIAQGAPDRVDFEFAQVRRIHALMGVGDSGTVHCYRFRSYRTHRTPNPAVYRVTYEEFRPTGPWRRLSAVLRREGEGWVWVEGDPPRCSITIITE